MDPQRLTEKVASYIVRAVRVVERGAVGIRGNAKQEAALSVLSVWCAEELEHRAGDVFKDPRVDVATRGLMDAYVHWVNVVCAVVRERP